MRLEEIQQAIQEERMDAWLFFDHHRRDPLAYRVLGLPDVLNPTRRWYYLIPAKGNPKKLLHKIEPSTLQALPGETSYYSAWPEQNAELGRLLKEHKRIAMQYSPECAIPYVAMVDGGTLELVRKFGVEVVSSANLVQLFEARWNQNQLESHLEAGRRMDRLRRTAFEMIGERLRNNEQVNEWEVKQLILDGMRKADLITDHGPIVAVNANASNPHYEPEESGNTSILPGDLVLIDMWAKLNLSGSVYYDITWTGFCGSDAPADVQRIFDVVKGARDHAVRCVQHAVSEGRPLCGYQVDDSARSFIRAAGFGQYFIHRTGHSIGTDVHGSGANMDNFETREERRIISSTCFSIEPGIYLPEFGIRSEVNVFVSESEARVTGEIQEKLVRILGD